MTSYRYVWLGMSVEFLHRKKRSVYLVMHSFVLVLKTTLLQIDTALHVKQCADIVPSYLVMAKHYSAQPSFLTMFFYAPLLLHGERVDCARYIRSIYADTAAIRARP